MDLFSIIFFAVGVPLTILTAIYAHSTYRYARADLAQQAGRYDEAERRLKKAATGINPFGRGIAYAALANIYLKTGRPHDAVASLRETVQRTKTPGTVMAAYQLFIDAALHPDNPGTPDGYLGEGEKLLTATRMPGGMKGVLYGQYAHTWWKLGNLTETKRLIDLALDSDPLNASALYLAAWLELSEGRVEEAEDHFRNLAAVRDKEQRPLGVYGLATSAFYQDDLKQADYLYGRVIAEGSKLIEPFTYARMVICRQLMGQEARNLLVKAEKSLHDLQKRQNLPQDSSAKWLIHMARAYLEGNREYAREALRMAPPQERSEAEALASGLVPDIRAEHWSLKPPQAQY